MIKKLSILIIGVAIFSIKAQTFSFVGAKKLVVTLPPSVETEAKIHIKNLTNGLITLQYQKIVADEPAGWSFSLCDNINCYSPWPLKEKTSPIKKTDDFYFKAAVNPARAYDTVTAQYLVWDSASPNVKDTFTFVFGLSKAMNIHSSNAQPVVKVVPNPAKDNVVITATGFVSAEITNTLGSIVVKETNNKTISIKELPAGVYFVRVKTNAGTAVSRIIKK